MTKIELLIPAKDLSCGKIAINHGADALYIGAPRFGARQAAGNTLSDLGQLVHYAHLYGSKVYVTVNTLLYDNELEDACKLVWQLYELGADALIIQDFGLLKMDLPPILLHASTQCHNNSLERILFLEKLGMKRAILAREMDLETIRDIHAHSNIELETFIHGALCVCYSGQCYMSRMTTGRSGNRGECAQVCRTPFDLVDANGKVLFHDKHLLSLRDMNRAAYLHDIIDVGVISLKVEGRLKDEAYIQNVTGYYRQLLDSIFESDHAYDRLGSGRTTLFFEPDPARTFSRGFTPYFIDGQRRCMASFDTPKAKGKSIGYLQQDRSGRIFYEGDETLVNGDGLCFVGENGELEGFFVNGVSSSTAASTPRRVAIRPSKVLSSFKRVEVFRNVDKQFEKILSDKGAERKIAVDMRFEETADGFELQLCDEDGCKARVERTIAKEPAMKPDVAMRQLKMSLAKLGGTPFALRELTVTAQPCFLQASLVNAMRGEAVERLMEVRAKHFHPKDTYHDYHPEPIYTDADYKRNITNELHRAVYEDFGAGEVEYGIDKTLDFDNKEVMVCKYCIRYEIGACSKLKGGSALALPLYLKNARYKFRLDFDCKECIMKVLSEKGSSI